MIVKNPICGMEIDPQTAFATRELMGKTIGYKLKFFRLCQGQF
jgi:YHS domain-containing protein